MNTSGVPVASGSGPAPNSNEGNRKPVYDLSDMDLDEILGFRLPIPDEPPHIHIDEVPSRPESPIMDTESDAPFTTVRDQFGLHRVYPFGAPTYIPPSDRRSTVQPTSTLKAGAQIDFTDCPVNQSVRLFLNWFWKPGSRSKSQADANSLVTDVLLHPHFKIEELSKFRGVGRETELLDEFLSDPNLALPAAEGWNQTSVHLPVPSTRSKARTEAEAPKYEVKGVYYRPLMRVIRSALSEEAAKEFHLFPYREYWTPSSAPESQPVATQRSIDELYTADSFLREYGTIRRKVREMGDQREVVVLGLMFWSDATHLAQFGTASLWPIYTYIGNLSKYTRSKPSSKSAYHTAYIPKISDRIFHWFRETFGVNLSPAHQAFLKKELVHAVWALLMDPEFMYAYVHGFEWEFWDKVIRLVFPRIFTHSSDYPERLIIACLRYFARCPCPRCLMEKEDIYRLGTTWDRNFRRDNVRVDSKDVQTRIKAARSLVFSGSALGNEEVENEIRDTSLTLTRSTHSIKLGEHGFNVYNMLVPDPLHDFDVGVFKSVFSQLVRILNARGRKYPTMMNERFREIPPCKTIRRFANNVSEMKRLAGRDFEDILQCAIPALENLFEEEHNTLIRKLLFELATWQALAKLRRHTESTLSELDTSTTRLGTLLRKFVRDTEAYETRDLPSEVASKSRAKAARVRRQMEAGEGVAAEEADGEGPMRRSLSLLTAKLHSLGHYVEVIKKFGSSDGWTTRIGETEHKHSKGWYSRAQKGDGRFVGGIAAQEQRERVFQHLDTGTGTGAEKSQDTLEPMGPDEQVKMSHDKEEPRLLSRWLAQHKNDPAFEGFYEKLITHVYHRLHGSDYTDDEHELTAGERQMVIIEKDMIYAHKTVRIAYTRYDTRREIDTINPSSQADIMMLSHDDRATIHPYWYARVVSIFHVCAYLENPQDPAPPVAKDIEILWIRWFGFDYGHRWGWKVKNLPRVGFIDASVDRSSAFGFISPYDVIRAVHLSPCFESEQGVNGLGPSVVRRPEDHHLDWNYLYVNLFSDCDMFMRFRGGGIGHEYVRQATNVFLKDRDVLDKRRVAAAQEDSEEDAEEDTESDEDEPELGETVEDIESFMARILDDWDEYMEQEFLEMFGDELKGREDDQEGRVHWQEDGEYQDDDDDL
ncbi:hypothetical protein CC2G_004487 [Coprinopsis cinerea AmutBmut pab1-1]|nr:hypothetical protein CC2G_004487 [Coprinopsis cinerea AmutBmut pab1-1]